MISSELKFFHRVIQLQADVEALGKQFKQEINDLQQKKFDKTQVNNFFSCYQSSICIAYFLFQSLENYKNDIKTGDDRLRGLQSQLLEAE